MILQSSRGVLSSGGFDPMAARYLKAVETAGATVTSTQRAALDNFFKKGKSEGWISSLRRMFLPIWGSAAANAIDMKIRATGTYVGGVTHAAGYIQGDGTSGYFNMNAAQAALGLAPSTGYYLALVNQAAVSSSKAFLGVGSAGNAMVLRADTATVITGRHYGLTVGSLTSSATTSNGIISFSRQGGNRTIWRRSSSSRVAIAGPIAGADSGNNVISSMIALASNNSDTGMIPVSFSNVRMGVILVGSGLTESDDEGLTSAIKTLWETCTGLTLP